MATYFSEMDPITKERYSQKLKITFIGSILERCSRTNVKTISFARDIA